MSETAKLENRVALPTWVHAALTDPGPTWLIDQVIPSQGLTVIAGRPKLSKKSWLAMLMGMVMSSGREVQGLKPSGKNPILYLSLEGTPFSTAQRFQMLEKGMGLPISQCTDFYFSLNERFFLDEPRFVTDLVDFIVAHDIKCVFIDTFARAFKGDENQAKDVGAAMRGVAKILSAQCAVVLVHHLRKRQEKNSPEDFFDPDSGMRGSTALSGAMDNIISIKNVPNESNNGYDTWFIIGGKQKNYIAREVNWLISKDDSASLNLGHEEDIEAAADKASNTSDENIRYRE